MMESPNLSSGVGDSPRSMTWMVDLSQGLRFGEYATQTAVASMEKFQRDPALELDVEHGVDRAHRATAEFVDDHKPSRGVPSAESNAVLVAWRGHACIGCGERRVLKHGSSPSSPFRADAIRDSLSLTSLSVAPTIVGMFSRRWLGALVVGFGCTSPGAAAETDVTAPTQCPAFSAATQTGTIEVLALDEASGLVASQVHAGVLWSHNDGDEAALYALDGAGQLFNVVALEDAAAEDIEDIARSDAQSTDILWLADIGDNEAVRPYVQLLAVPEPDTLGEAASISARVRVAYPSGPIDAEAFFIDPRSGDGYIIAKVQDPQMSARVFRVPGPLAEGDVVAEEVGTIETLGPITAADLRDDVLIVRSSGSAVWWSLEGGQTIADVLTMEPCAVPVGPEQQGEAIALVDRGYVTTSEGPNAPIHRVDQL